KDACSGNNNPAFWHERYFIRIQQVWGRSIHSELAPGDGRDIEVRIKSNQVGDFNVNGRIIYYFGEEKDKAEDHTLNLPIKVRKEIASTPAQNPTAAPAQKSTLGFELIIGISALSLAVILKRRCYK
ncbi:MAG: hypothetical protein Q8O41_10135, partial [Candidatus Methanoperedens sp.]|nr:hypothetical protein [Candidatus Methanoperedens sp.]